MTPEQAADFSRIAPKAEAIEDAREASGLRGLKFSSYIDPTYIYNKRQQRAGFQFLNKVGIRRLQLRQLLLRVGQFGPAKGNGRRHQVAFDADSPTAVRARRLTAIPSSMKPACRCLWVT